MISLFRESARTLLVLNMRQIISALLVSTVTTINISSRCGFPGQPINTPPIPLKTSYEDGEEVVYSACPYSYLLRSQKRMCVRGRWEGPEARCGKKNVFNTPDLIKQSNDVEISIFSKTYSE